MRRAFFAATGGGKACPLHLPFPSLSEPFLTESSCGVAGECAAGGPREFLIRRKPSCMMPAANRSLGITRCTCRAPTNAGRTLAGEDSRITATRRARSLPAYDPSFLRLISPRCIFCFRDCLPKR